MPGLVIIDGGLATLGGGLFTDINGTDCCCEPTPPGPEACCFEGGACQDLERATCIGAGGTPQGPGTTCANVQCQIGDCFPCLPLQAPAGCGPAPGCGCGPTRNGLLLGSFSIAPGDPCGVLVWPQAPVIPLTQSGTSCSWGGQTTFACGPSPCHPGDPAHSMRAVIVMSAFLDCNNNQGYGVGWITRARIRFREDFALGGADPCINPTFIGVFATCELEITGFIPHPPPVIGCPPTGQYPTVEVQDFCTPDLWVVSNPSVFLFP